MSAHWRATPGPSSTGEGVPAPDAVVWGMRGLLFLADRHEVLRQVHSAIGAARTVVAPVTR